MINCYICFKYLTLRFLQIILYVFVSQIFFGQNPYYNAINKADGLLTNSVYDIYEDKNDYMWFATEKGLCNFNGYTFNYFFNKNMTTKSGSCIKEDALGRIWYENFDGYLYYVENKSLKKLNQNKALGYFKYGFIDNKLYTITEMGLNVHNLKTLQLVKTIPINTAFLKTIYLSKNEIYIFTDALQIIKNDKIVQTINYPEDFSKKFNSIIVEKSADGLIICSKFTNYYYEFENGAFIKKTTAIKNGIIQNLSWCNNENWICTTSGVAKLNNTNNPIYFEGKNISYVYKTKNANYWVSTLTEGLFFIDNFSSKLIASNETLTAICKTNNKLLLGTNNDKIIQFNQKTENFSTLYQGTTNHQISLIKYDNYNDLFFFTSSKFGILSAKYKLLKDYSIAIKNVAIVDKKYISFAASGSLGLFQTNNKSVSSWDSIFNTNNSKDIVNYSNFITNAKGKATLFDAAANIIYYATNNGVFFINTKGQKKELLFNGSKININKFSSFEKNIFASNNEYKLYKIYNQTVKEVQLPAVIDRESIEKVFLKNELYYIVTNKYIFEYSIIKNKLKPILQVNNGIEINDILLDKNTYYFTTNKGLIIRENSFLNKNKINFFVDNVLVNNKIASKENRENLSHDKNNIIINYSLISSNPFNENVLKYSINNSDWQKLPINSNKLILTSLNSGNYTVQFAINDKIFSAQKVQFFIKNPFWLQAPFLLFSLLIFSVLLYILYKRKIRIIQQKNQMLLDKISLEKNINQSKLKAIKSQMNPHFFYNALNTVQSFILSNDKKQAVNYLSKFSVLTRTILEMTEKDLISIAEEVKTLQLYLEIEQVRFNDDFNFDISVSSTIDSENVKIPSMFLQPFVENAVKHGLLHKTDEKTLKINFDTIDNTIKIIIDDNGIGRVKSNELNQIKNKKHQSFATAALQNRVHLLNEFTQNNISIEYIDKTNQSNQSLGTTVIIIIPILY